MLQLTWCSPLLGEEAGAVKAEVGVGKARLEKAEVAAGVNLEVGAGAWEKPIRGAAGA